MLLFFWNTILMDLIIVSYGRAKIQLIIPLLLDI